MGLHQTKKLLHSKVKEITKLKRQPTEWEKIFANCTSDRGLITEYIESSKNKLHKDSTIYCINEQMN
jgi:hypothetical protein